MTCHFVSSNYNPSKKTKNKTGFVQIHDSVVVSNYCHEKYWTFDKSYCRLIQCSNPYITCLKILIFEQYPPHQKKKKIN